MLATLKEEGQPLEDDWRYLASLPSDLDAYGPPANVVVFRRDGESRTVGIDQISGIVQQHRLKDKQIMKTTPLYLPRVSQGWGIVAGGCRRDHRTFRDGPSDGHADVAV
jgi:hypothetical protein